MSKIYSKKAIPTIPENGQKNLDAPYLVESIDKTGRVSKTAQIIGNLSRDDLLKLGSERSPIKAIRAHCIECSGGKVGEVKKCTAYRCPLWPFRMGKNPFHGLVGRS